MSIFIGAILAIIAILCLIAINREQDLPKPIGYKLFIGLTLLFIVLFAWQVYNPALSKFIGAAEINPSFTLALILAAAMAALIAGPIAFIRWLQFELKLKQERDVYDKEWKEKRKE